MKQEISDLRNKFMKSLDSLKLDDEQGYQIRKLK